MLPVKYDDLTSEERKRVREQYWVNQKGLCCHCDSRLDSSPSSEVAKTMIDTSLFPTGFFNYPVHLHHSHKTGYTIGAIHNVCNAILFQYFGE